MEILASLGIDLWGVLLYAVNFGILFIILRKYLYNPLLKFLDERREVIRNSIEAAEKAREEFKKKELEHEQELKAKTKDLEAEILLIKQAAMKEAAEQLQMAENRRDKMLAEARAVIDEAKTSLIKDVQAELLVKLEKTVLLILKESASEKDVKKSVTEAWEEIMLKK